MCVSYMRVIATSKLRRHFLVWKLEIIRCTGNLNEKHFNSYGLRVLLLRYANQLCRIFRTRVPPRFIALSISFEHWISPFTPRMYILRRYRITYYVYDVHAWANLSSTHQLLAITLVCNLIHVRTFIFKFKIYICVLNIIYVYTVLLWEYRVQLQKEIFSIVTIK
jgi:hypothetical protein